MKSFNPLQYRQLLWTAGGGGGGGGGGDCCFETITVAALQALISGGTLEAGRTYLVTDVSADWQVMTRAMTISSVTTQCNAIYQGSLYAEAWWDAITNTLWKIYDPKFNNEVEGTLNIAQFTWNDASWFDNKIVAGSTFIAGAASLGQFNGNIIGPGATFDMTGAVILNVSLNIVSNNCTLTLNNATLDSLVSNNLKSGSSLLLDNSTMTTVLNNELSSGASISLQNATASGLFYNNMVSGGAGLFLIGSSFDSVYGNSISNSSVVLSGASLSTFNENQIVASSITADSSTVVQSIVGNTISSVGSLILVAATITSLSYNHVGSNSIFDITGIAAASVDYNIVMNESVVDFTGAVISQDITGNKFYSSTATATSMAAQYIRYNIFNSSVWSSVSDVLAVIIHNELLASSLSTAGCAGCTLDGNRILGDSQLTLSAESTALLNNTIDNGSIVSLDGNAFNRFRNNQFIGETNATIQFATFDTYSGNIISGAVILQAFCAIQAFSYNTILNSTYIDQSPDNGDVSYNTFNVAEVTLLFTIHHCEIVGTLGRVTVIIPQNYSYCSFTYGVASTFTATADFADATQYNSATKTWTLASPYDGFVGVWSLTNSVAATDQIDNVVNVPAHPVLIQADTTIKQFRQNGGNILISGAGTTANLNTTEDIITFIPDRASSGWRMTNYRKY